jgi:YidC/Oxa1 family membrane protein insertase
MERGSLSRWIFLGLAVFLFIQFGLPLLTGGDKASERQPLGGEDAAVPEARLEPTRCELSGNRFRAVLSSRGASLEHLVVQGEAGRPDRYVDHETKQPIDLVTTELEARAPLRTTLRLPGDGPEQVPYADFDWKLDEATNDRCVFSFADASVKLVKTVTATGAPFELAVSLTVENLSAEPKKHRFTIEQTANRTQKAIEGSLGSQSEHLTEVVAAATEIERHEPHAFDPSSFDDEGFTEEKWRRAPGEGRWAATSSAYFTAAVVHVAAPAAPAAETQIEEYWDIARFQSKKDDPGYEFVYRARLAYPEMELAPQAKATYETLAFLGPKERKLLGAMGAGKYPITDVVDLGWAAFIGQTLLTYVYFLHEHVVSTWGFVICLLTITVRVLLFPLSISQIKNSVAMRRLKPEMDALGEKFKDDMAQRGLAMQELWRKNGVSSPIVGCLPVLLQMPVWIALYRVLQTTVELYNEPFGPLISDLSRPDTYHIIPIVLGASSFMQQKIMPMQGDPQQQKMMLYMMPAVFTVMMFFLPAGLGVYMMTSTWLGIGQQLLVERYIRSRMGAPATIAVKEKTEGGDDKPSRDIGKGKARAHG